MGMPKIEFRVAMFRGDWDQIWSQHRLLLLMEALCKVNETHIRQYNAFYQRGLIPAPYPLLYRSGLHYEREKGTEIWPDIPGLLEGVMGKGDHPGIWGDCLPVETLVLRDDGALIPLGAIRVGDVIMGEGRWTKVLAHAVTGLKDVIGMQLSNKSAVYPSASHRLFKIDGTEVRGEDVKEGDVLRAQDFDYKLCRSKEVVGSEVRSVYPAGVKLCADITTDTGRFFLPESGLIVHNCEDLACYRIAELRVLGGIRAKPFAKWRRRGGVYAYHALVLLPDGRIEDPSLVLGMGREDEFARLGLAEAYKSGALVPKVQYAEKPMVMAVDPEKPSGYTGGIAAKLDAKVLAAMSKADLAENHAYETNTIQGDHHEIDRLIGWNPHSRQFVPSTDKAEMQRLLGYASR